MALKKLKKLAPFSYDKKTFNGIALGGRRYEVVNKSISSPENYAVEGVPIDKRLHAYKQFRQHLDWDKCSERSDLLCSAAYKGSGKTTLLCINMKWFVDATRGIAIHVSFGDEQSRSEAIWKDQVIQTKRDFQLAFAVRVLHRLVANSENSSYVSMRTRIDVTLSDMVEGFTRPIPQALELVRKVLGVPDDTKIMLAVDEIAKAAERMEILSPAELLAELALHVDEDAKLFLSVAAYGAVDVQKLCTDSNRQLFSKNRSF